MNKTVSVSVPGGRSKMIVVDTDIFDDIYVEACTRALESLLKENNLKMTPTMQCCVEESSEVSDIVSVNTYKVLLNGSMPKQAEFLRQHLIKSMKIDWREEPLIIKN